MKILRVFFTLLITGSFLVFTAQSCIKKNEPSPEDYETGEDVGYTVSLLTNIYDAALDAAQTIAASPAALPTIFPSDVTIAYSDSLYTDGDGIEYEVAFRSIDSINLSGGTHCVDERIRAGSFFISQTKPINEVGAVLTLTLSNDNRIHYVGNGSDMIRFNGTIVITRSGVKTFSITTNVDAKYKNGKVHIETGEERKEVSNIGQGIWNAVYEVTGSGKGITREGSNFTFFVATVLQKNIQPICSRTYVQGMIEVKNTTENANVTINFDPQFNKECDRLFAVSLTNGQAKTYKIN